MGAIERQRAGAHAAALAGALLLTLLVYLPSLDNGFTNWDDPAYLVDNPLVRRPTPGGLWRLATSFQSGNFHPLTMLLLAVEHGLFGGDARGYHAVSLALHLGNTALVFAVARALGAGAAGAAAAAALFGVHPLHVESVAWVAEQKDVLSAFFFLAALVAYAAAGEGPRRRRRLAGVFVLLLLSLLAKPMAVTFPLVMVLCDWVGGQGAAARRLREKAPFFALAAAFAAVAVLAQRSAGAIRHVDAAGALTQGFVAARGLVFYLAKFVLPVRLSVIYPYPPGTGLDLPLSYLLAPLAVGALAAGVALAARRGRTVPFGALFAAITLAPVLQLVPTGSMVAADRYFYLPSLGLCVLAGAGLERLTRPAAAGPRPWTRPAAAALAAAAVLVAFSLLAFRRTEVWRDGLTLWSDALARQPGVALAWNNRGNARADRGEHELALADFAQALRLEPGMAQAHYSRGNSLAALGRLPDAASAYGTAIALDPRHARARYNRGLALLEMGAPERAAADLRQAVALSPAEASFHANLGLALARSGRLDEAVGEYREAIRLDDAAAEAWTNLGAALSALGRLREALEANRRAIALAPRSVAPRFNLGLDLLQLGRAAEAEATLRAALALDPADRRVREALELVRGRPEAAPTPGRP